MINPVYQQMVVKMYSGQLLPLTADKKLTQVDLQNLANQESNLPEPVVSTIMFLLNNFAKLSSLGDKDASSISEQDMQTFSQQGINLEA